MKQALLPLAVAVAPLLLASAPGAVTDSPSPPPPTATLTVDADGFQSGAGHAFARLYRPGDNVVGPPWRVQRVDIRASRARFDFPDLAPGAYAVVVHHDVNDNGRIDHDAIGLPSEPLGFSNGFKLGLFSGKPTFEKLRFSFAAGSSGVRVTVR